MARKKRRKKRTRKYAIVYADPPWAYRDKAHAGRRGVEYKYPSLDPKRIRDLDVASITADDAALFLWVTPPQLDAGIEVLRAWGFTFKTVAFVWVKKNKLKDSLFWGMGHWTRANAELVLLGVKGRPKVVSRGVHQVVISRIGRHSEKPPDVRERIVELMGDEPRIELFARERSAGWDVWGNEVACKDILRFNDDRQD